VLLSTTIREVTAAKICCETVLREFNICFDLFMHVDISKIFTGIEMLSQLHLAQFSHLSFEECHSELCGVFGIPRKGNSFRLIYFRFRDIDKAQSGDFEKNCPLAIMTSPEVISNGNRTERSPIRSLIIRVINKIGRPRSGIPIC